MQAHVAVNCRPFAMRLCRRIVTACILPEIGELPIIAVDRAGAHRQGLDRLGRQAYWLWSPRLSLGP